MKLVIIDTDNTAISFTKLVSVLDGEDVVFMFFGNANSKRRYSSELGSISCLCKAQVDFVWGDSDKKELTDLMICHWLGQYGSTLREVFDTIIMVSADASLYKAAMIAKAFVDNVYAIVNCGVLGDSAMQKTYDFLTAQALNIEVPMIIIKHEVHPKSNKPKKVIFS